MPDSMKASTLLELIASERNWPSNLVLNDLEILEKNRLFTISDLKVLSKESWKQIGLLPIVKDLIQAKIYKNKKKAKKMKKKYQSTSESSEEESINESTELAKAHTNGESKNGSQSIKPLSIVPDGNMIKVAAADGTIYQTNRYCPHKKVDLVTKGRVSGNTLVCTKHNWIFDLKNGGSCTNKPGNSIRACQLNDW
ncbi:hypothetical protein K502DRAFT_300703 [Neoconidiobolus thromboides FSU 785]|nr:hypothetical protein K502DRAFT_300703 [Neoconidiobolus thromboides FSU 785]